MQLLIFTQRTANKRISAERDCLANVKKSCQLSVPFLISGIWPEIQQSYPVSGHKPVMKKPDSPGASLI